MTMEVDLRGTIIPEEVRLTPISPAGTSGLQVQRDITGYGHVFFLRVLPVA